MLGVKDQVGLLCDAKHGVITGWVNNQKQFSPPVKIEVFAQSISLGQCSTSSTESHQGTSAFGTQCFALHLDELPPELKPPYSIRAQVVETEAQLDGEIRIETRVQHDEALQAFAGAVSGLKDGAVEGWVLRKSAPGDFISVEMLLNGSVVGSGVADRIEPGSPAYGTGHGFHLPLPAQVLNGAVHNLRIRVASNALDLDGSPVPIVLLAIPSLLQRIASVEQNAADMSERLDQVYTELFDKAYQSIGTDLARRIDAVALLQRDAFERNLAGLRSRLGETPSSLLVPPQTESSFAEVVFNDNLVGYGWYHTEMLPVIGSFRWMGESATTIIDFSTRTAATLRIFVVSVLDANQITHLSITVNGSIVIFRVSEVDNGLILEAEVPVQVFLRAPYAAVTVKTKFSRKPGNGDDRKLSIGVRAIQLVACPG